MKEVVENMKRPAPKWYRILNKVWSPTENTVIGVLLLTGHTGESLYMLLFKMGSSYLRTLLDIILVESINPE